MDLFADENIARPVVAWLRGRGHDVLYASEAHAGAPDSDWLARAEAEERLILTADTDFGELIFRDGLTSHGVVLLRLGTLTLSERLTRLDSAWPTVEANPSGKFIVITQAKIRIRDLTVRR
jgi:predicted nuclease of predicted toxin-antitoxin system